MPHETALIATLAAGLGLAFVFGFVAVKLRLTPLVGYLLAGVVCGPFTPGYVADAGLASQLAEIGVILLMFGVGIHFSPRDLLAVRKVAVPGAIAQIAAATGLGALVAHFGWDWSWGAGVVFGLSLSVASTVVLLRALEDRGALDSVDGRIAVGWLIVEDLITVLALVLLPVFATPEDGSTEHTNIAATIGLTLGKVAVFIAFMYVVGRRVVPWLLVQVARTGSRELFTLGVLGIALGIAVGAASLFGVSFALGAFFAGVVISESDLSHQAASDALPLQDAFGVLFFVAVGMLFDPSVLTREPLQLLAVLLIVLVGKSLCAALIVLAFRYPLNTALTVSASLAQVGEFSFILIGLGVTYGLVPASAQSLIVAGAILSITLNPLVFKGVAPVGAWIRARPKFAAWLERPAGELAELPRGVDADRLRNHAVIVGHGRVGGPIAEALGRAGVPYVVVEQSRPAVERLQAQGLPVVYGDATRPGVLAHAHLERARLLVLAAPDPIQARVMLDHARRANPAIDVVVRTHSDAERTYLEQRGVGLVVLGESELATAMTRYALARFERDAASG